MRRSGSRVRVSARLTDATAETQLWGETFERALGDIFDMLDRITESVVGLVEPCITRAEIERARRKRPESLDAYDHFPSGSVAPAKQREPGTASSLFRPGGGTRPNLPAGAGLGSLVPRDPADIWRERPASIDLADRALVVAGEDGLVFAIVGLMYQAIKDDAEAAFALSITVLRSIQTASSF